MGKSHPAKSVCYMLLLASLWMLLSGQTEVLLLFLGGASILLVGWLSHRMQLVDDEGFPVQHMLAALIYIPWLFVQIVRSNMDIAKRILDPSLPIEPREIKLSSSQVSDLGRVIYANSITLTPGTVTMGISGRELHVHALTGGAAEGLQQGEMDCRVTKLEEKS